MAERVRKAKPQSEKQETTSEPAAKKTRSEEGRERVKLEDEFLDEIDSILEENAEEFVKNYVQKGGQ